jgi:predicted nucleotide-binding protein
MAPSKRPPPEQSPPELLMQRADASLRLDDRIAKGRDLKKTDVTNAGEYEALKSEKVKWSEYNHELLMRMFTTDGAARDYSFFGFGTGVMNASWQTRVEELRRDIDLSIQRLESIQERLELMPLSDSLKSVAATPRQTANDSKQVFLVHGRNEGAREKVARFVRRLLGAEPIILHEQPSQGRSLIEKLEQYGNVGFAIVLLTPDDEGRVAGSDEPIKLRARQNVILELGYFIGLLGRTRVCALYGAGVEIPTDFLGVVYIPLDDGDGWHLRLAKELRAAGFDVDMNKL